MQADKGSSQIRRRGGSGQVRWSKDIAFRGDDLLFDLSVR